MQLLFGIVVTYQERPSTARRGDKTGPADTHEGGYDQGRGRSEPGRERECISLPTPGQPASPHACPHPGTFELQRTRPITDNSVAVKPGQYEAAPESGAQLALAGPLSVAERASSHHWNLWIVLGLVAVFWSSLRRLDRIRDGGQWVRVAAA
jgi:hypothetical protein